MDKNWSVKFNITHQNNQKLINDLYAIYITVWKNEGFPKEPTEIMKHIWTRIAGGLDRCNRILSGKDE